MPTEEKARLIAATLEELRPVICRMVADGAPVAAIQGRMAAEVARITSDSDLRESLETALAGATAAALDAASDAEQARQV